jgi:hypothetical protein
MSMQEHFDVADIDGGPVGFAAGGQELREVAHRGEPGLERGMPTRVGAGAAGTVTTPDEVVGESGHRVAQRFGHRVDAGLASGGGAAFVAIGPQRQLVRGQEVFRARASGTSAATLSSSARACAGWSSTRCLPSRVSMEQAQVGWWRPTR